MTHIFKDWEARRLLQTILFRSANDKNSRILSTVWLNTIALDFYDVMIWVLSTVLTLNVMEKAVGALHTAEEKIWNEREANPFLRNS